MGRHRAEGAPERGSRLEDVDLVVARLGTVAGHDLVGVGQRRPVDGVGPDLDGARPEIDPDEAHFERSFDIEVSCLSRCPRCPRPARR